MNKEYFKNWSEKIIIGPIEKIITYYITGRTGVDGGFMKKKKKAAGNFFFLMSTFISDLTTFRAQGILLNGAFKIKFCSCTLSLCVRKETKIPS